MKLNLSALQLLALCQIVAASPCKPSLSSVMIGFTTADITTKGSTATESITVPETSLLLSFKTGTETETEVEAATTTTEMVATSATATTFEAITASEPETVSTGSTTTSEATSEVNATSKVALDISTETETTRIELITASDGATSSETTATSDIPLIPTTSAEPTTTTTSIPQQPSNFLQNPSFEEATITPWTKVARIGAVSLSTSEFRSGTQSLRFAFDNLSQSAHLWQQIDPSLLQANKIYDLTAYTKPSTEAACALRIISCYSGSQLVGSTAGSATNAGVWDPLKVSCTWSQAQLDAGVAIRIFLSSYCMGMHVDWFVDDATLVEAV